MTTVPIAIDLRPFLHPFDPHTANPLLVLVGPSGEIFLTAPQQSLQLQPGRYEFVVASGVPSDFTFDVTAAGLIEYDPSFDTFLSGRGSRTLVIKGFEINFDARYLSGPISLFVLPDAVQILNTSIRLLPASSYNLEQGSGSVARWPLKIGLDGKVDYDRGLDISQGGFLSGRGTQQLQLFGFPLLVDARASGAASVVLNPTGNVTTSTTDITFANLLPTENVAVLLDSKRVPFVLDFGGNFRVSPSLAQFVQFDHFHGLQRMTVLRLPS